MSNISNIERELRAKELEALAAALTATAAQAGNMEFTSRVRENFRNAAESACELINDKLKDMYTRG